MATYQETVSETINFDDTPTASKITSGVVSEDIAFGDTATPTGTLRATVSENITFSMTLGANQLFATVSDTIAFLEQNGPYGPFNPFPVPSPQVVKKPQGVVQETITFDDSTPQQFYTARPTVSETLALNDTAIVNGRFGVVVSEVVSFSDTAAANARFQAIVRENIVFSTQISIENQIYECWVVNTKNLGLTEYLDFDFNSLVKHGDKYFASNEKGVFELTGDTDEGFLIKAAIKTAIMDFDSEFQKKVPRIYIGLRNNGDVILKTITNETTERWYNLVANQTGMGKSRVRPPKGVRSAYWQFEFVNATGDDFDLKEIQWLPIAKARRVK